MEMSQGSLLLQQVYDLQNLISNAQKHVINNEDIPKLNKSSWHLNLTVFWKFNKWNRMVLNVVESY